MSTDNTNPRAASWTRARMTSTLSRLCLAALVTVTIGASHAGQAVADPAESTDPGMIESLLQRAYERLALGAHDLAIQDLLEAQAVADQAGDDPRRTMILGSLGDAYLAAGQPRAAERALLNGLILARQTGQAALEAAILNSIGNLQLADGDPVSALDSYQESAAAAVRAERPEVVASAAINGARVLVGENDAAGAAKWLEEAETALAHVPAGSAKAMQLLAAGRQLTAIGAVGRAQQVFQEAEGIARAGGDLRLESYGVGYLGQLYEGQGRHDDALALSRRALFLAQAAEAQEVAYLWQWQIGRLLAATGDIDDAIGAYRQAVRALRQLRPELIAVTARSGRSALRTAVEPVYLELADLLLKRAAAQPARMAKQEDLAAARILIEQFRAAELEDYFQDDCVAELQARVRSVDQLATRTAAVYPIILPERTVLLLSLPEGLMQKSIPVTAEQLTSEVRTLRVLLEKRTTREYLAPAQALYDRLIRPIERDLDAAGIDTLVFVPDGPLRTIPLAALHDGERFLIDRYAVATVPGLDLLDPRPVATTEVTPLLNGLTESVQGFPALPHVAGELEAIAKLYGGKVLKDEEFVAGEFGESLAQTPYSVVHIASHGKFAGDPKDSFLLTYDGRLDMDGLEEFIKLSRFRDEPIELLTLSACQTAAGDDRAALGLAGVAIKAGARSALATLWFINDQASSLLVSEFYRQLSAKPTPTKAKALQAAQQRIRADLRYRHPAYWSPFLIIGNWL
jgi:CHAT domain-containing protein